MQYIVVSFLLFLRFIKRKYCDEKGFPKRFVYKIMQLILENPPPMSQYLPLIHVLDILTLQNTKKHCNFAL